MAEITELTIFNRWGSMVWQGKYFLPNQTELGWDGTFNNQRAKAGVSVFVAKVLFKNRNTKTFSGDFLLVE